MCGLRTRQLNPKLIPEQLRMIMLLGELHNLIVRPIIGEAQISSAELLIKEYLDQIFVFYPATMGYQNFHQLEHIPENLLDFGQDIILEIFLVRHRPQWKR